jgi:hypothetical protein
MAGVATNWAPANNNKNRQKGKNLIFRQFYKHNRLTVKSGLKNHLEDS